MTSRRFELHFAGRGDVQLVETRFTDISATEPRIAIRGKTPGAIRDAGTFQWTSAVRGLSVLVVRSVLARRDQTNSVARHILGFQASLAASLDYAITKQPQWVRDVFGGDVRGSSLAQRLIARTNPNRKRPGPVILSLNDRALPPECIEIIWDGRPVTDASDLQSLLLGLGDSEHAAVSEEALKAFVEKLAA